MNDPGKSRVYVGTYAGEKEESIFLYFLNTDTGELQKEKGFIAGKKPSYLVLNEQQNFLYAVNEKKASGSVCSFSLDKKSGHLEFLNRISSLGGEPVLVTMSKNGKVLIVANYQTGNVAVFPIMEDGKLAEATYERQHKGSGPHKDRQQSAHAHYTFFSPDHRFTFVVDLGLDKILSYILDEENGVLTAAQQPVAFSADPGSGPRQLSFHPNGRYAYLIHELKSTITALSYDKVNGTFLKIQTIGTIPENFNEKNKCGGIRVSPDGRFVYGSNRGHNSIAAYKINQDNGKLSYLENVSSGGDWPREFAVDPKGKWLLVANQRSNNIISFKIDQETGRLGDTGYQVEDIKPVFLQVVTAIE